MKQIFFSLFVFISFVACSQKEETIVLQEGTPAFELAVALAEKVPGVSPDSNKVLIKTDYFDISSGEVIQLLQSTQAARVHQLKTMIPPQIKIIIEQNAERLAEQKLLHRAAEKAGIGIREMQIDSVLQSNYTMAGGEEQFKAQLERNSMTIDYVRESIKTNLAIQNYIEKTVLPSIEITDAELEQAFNKLDKEGEKASVRHILLMTQGKNEQDKATIRKKMAGILERARNGEDFAELARKYTEDPGSKNNGGLYENFSRGTMVKPFEDAAFSIPVGEISDIVETQYGYHILKIVDRSKESNTLEEAKPKLIDDLRKSKQNEFVMKHISELKENAHFEKVSL